MGVDNSYMLSLFRVVWIALFKSLLNSTKLSLNMFANFILTYVVRAIGMKYFTLGTVPQENLTLLHANTRGADQPLHQHSLISAFGIRSLASMAAKYATNTISLF